jgi:hemin uptake protein HemP
MSVNNQTATISGSRLNRMKSSKMIESHVLLGDNQQIIIKHMGENYCLRRTRQNKLILTK